MDSASTHWKHIASDGQHSLKKLPVSRLEGVFWAAWHICKLRRVVFATSAQSVHLNTSRWAIARKLVDEFVSRFGAPETLHTDQGRNFESNLFNELCRLLGIVKTRTSAYHPEGDGMIERFNRTVVSMLSNYVSDNQRDWDRHLPQVMMAYRSSKYESTKYPPFFMMFGRDVKLPIDVMCGRAPGQPQETVEYTRGLRDPLEAAHNKARTHLQAAQKRQKDYYDRRVAGTSFRVGDWVLLSTTAVKRGLSPKLHHQWQGPYVVLDKVSEVNYRVQLATGQGRKQVVHFNRLRPFNHARPMLHLDEADDDANNNNEPVQRPAARPHFGAAEYQLDKQICCTKTTLLVSMSQPMRIYRLHNRTYLTYDFRSWNGETGFVYLAISSYFLAVDRKWSGHWRFSRSEAFRVRVWYTLWVMLRHIAWTSWNRIGKKRHTRNRLFVLKMGYFLSLVSPFPSGSFKSREKWSFV